jgi:hypothetical protein
MDDFIPFDEEFGVDPDLFIEDFPAYLMDKVKDWMRGTLRQRGYLINTNVSNAIVDPLEFRLRTNLSRNIGSFIAYFTVDTRTTRNFLSYLLQYHSTDVRADRLKTLLRDASSAYTIESLPDHDKGTSHGGFILVNRTSVAERMQAEAAISKSNLLKDAYIAAYKVQPDYSKAVRKSSDHVEGLLTNKFWNGRTTTYTVHQALEKFERDPNLLTFKGAAFVKDKTKVIALLDGIARIREEHTTGTGRAPTPDEAEFVVQTAIYLQNILEPVDPIPETIS